MNNNNTSPLQHAIADYETTFLAGRNLAPETRRHYLSDVRQLLTFLQSRGIDSPTQVERRHLESFLAELDHQQLRGSSRRRKVAAIRSFFAYLQDQGVLSLSPALKLIPPEREQTQPRVLTKSEYQRLQLAVRNDAREKAMIELILQTGLRLSEVARLSMQDLELPAKATKESPPGSVTVIGKGRKTRTVTLNYKASGALKAWLQVRDDELGYPHVFLTKFRKPMSPRSIENSVNKYLQAAGIPNASVHTLRHTWATHFIRNGGSLKSAQQMLGHASLKTTEIYVHLAREQMDKEVQEHAL